MTEPTVGSLFAGIGGFDLGLERAGFEVKWQVEIDPFCRRVLAKHWPHVRRYEDVRTVGRHNLEPVDVICGGFPCQDISSNNQNKRGIEGPKSGLWREMLRVVREMGPPVVVVENVSDLLVRGLGTVLGELADVGYDAEWESLPAAAFGLPQRRWRVFIVAYPSGSGREVGDEWFASRSQPRIRLDRDGLAQAQLRASEAASRVRGMDDGLPGTVDRVAALGNSVSPQITEWIGRRLIASLGLPTVGPR